MILIEITDDFIVETDILIALVVANVAVMFVDFTGKSEGRHNTGRDRQR